MERIRMIGLGKSFGVRQVFSNVSFEIKEGDRIALVGPNGAGKSTLLKCILGIEELDEGQVVTSPVASIGYLQQDVNLGDASLAEEIETAWEDVHALEDKLHKLTTYLETHEASESDLQRLDYLQNRLEWLGGYDYEQKTKRIVYGLGFTDEDAYNKFGFLIDAFKFGTPPHGGIAFGLDRLVMLLAGAENIREVIAFPKNQNAVCPMTNAPTTAEDDQLKELSIRVEIEDKE